MKLLAKCVTGSVCIGVMAASSWGQNKPSQQALLEADRRAAATGSSAACLKYARDLNEGNLSRRNYSEAFRLFSQQSQQGSAEGTAWLGSMYLLGHGVPADPQKARELLTNAAGRNDGVANRFLGVMAQNGTGESRDYSKALHYYRLASRLGDANSFDKRGLLRIAGLGAPKSPEQAFSLFYKGATMGDSWAQLHLGQMFRSGEAYLHTTAGTVSGSAHPDYFHAIQWFKISAKQNNRIAQYELGRMVLHGLGTTRHPRWAFILFQKSASREYAPAYVALGQAFERGQGTQRSLPYAFVAYSLAAEQGNEAGMRGLKTVSNRLSGADLQRAERLLAEHEQRSSMHPGSSSDE